MRAIWKGSINFGLVNIPVALYPATKKSAEVSFRMLRDSDRSPIKFKRVAESDEKEVPYEHIVKGYEFEKGRFVVLEDKDLERVELESTQTVNIIDFVPEDEINPMFFSKPYYMEPSKGGAKAYALLREALKESGKVGIAKVVIKTREYLAAVKPVKNILVLELMHFADELVEPEAFNIPKGDGANKGEMNMAKMLIDKMSNHFNPEKYKDEYRSAVMDLIEKKIAAGDEKLPPAEKKRRPATNVIDLAEVLKQSLEKAAGKLKSQRAPKSKAGGDRPGRAQSRDMPASRRRKSAA